MMNQVVFMELNPFQPAEPDQSSFLYFTAVDLFIRFETIETIVLKHI